MTFYVARHGQTEWNAENKVCGITDIALTEKGIVQAGELAEQNYGVYEGVDRSFSITRFKMVN